MNDILSILSACSLVIPGSAWEKNHTSLFGLKKKWRCLSPEASPPKATIGIDVNRTGPGKSRKNKRLELDKTALRSPAFETLEIRVAAGRALPYGRKTRGGLTLHDMRHSFTTYLRKAGISIPVRMKLTGHETGEMDRRYDKVDFGDLKHAVNSLESYLLSNDHLTTTTLKPTIH